MLATTHYHSRRTMSGVHGWLDLASPPPPAQLLSSPHLPPLPTALTWLSGIRLYKVKRCPVGVNKFGTTENHHNTISIIKPYNHCQQNKLRIHTPYVVDRIIDTIPILGKSLGLGKLFSNSWSKTPLFSSIFLIVLFKTIGVDKNMCFLWLFIFWNPFGDWLETLVHIRCRKVMAVVSVGIRRRHYGRRTKDAQFKCKLLDCQERSP
jgi:hypothetical protein